MMRALQIAITTGLMMIAGLCHATEHIEIVLDTSMEMWGSFPDGTTRIVAVRKAINAFVASPAAGGEKFEFGLRTIGGRSEITIDSGCADSDSLIANGPVDPAHWSSALAGLDLRGGRALVHAAEMAAEDLSNKDGEKRIVIVTAGADQCHRDISALLESLSEAENSIEVRIIGLGMDQKLANSLVLSTPTRNISDPNRLLDTLRWAAAPQTAASNRAEWIEFMITRGDKPVDGAILYMVDRYLGEEASTSIVEGAAEMRLTPSRYRARIEGPEIGTIELDDIVHLDTQETLEVVLSPTPPVTLEVDPERPLAGAEAYIQYWGAPPGTNLVAVAAVGTPVGQYLLRKPVTRPNGEVRFPLPDSPNELEVQFTRDIGSGIQQLLGRLEFSTSRRRVTVEVPERAEIQTPMTLTWSGGGLPGDHIIIEYQEDDLREEVLCIPAVGDGPATINAPEPAGDYVVRYRSRQGRSLARDRFEAYEILATLQGPTTAAPGEVINVTWTGPDAAQDFLSIAAYDEGGEQYRRFAPTTNGNPAVLTAPIKPGDYEIRYVRGADEEILARQPLAVLVAEVGLDVPSVVEAGTRFEVAWSGTAGEGDFITVARAHSGPKKHLDWTYTDLGSPVTLAAPFEAGKYVVRYVSGTTNKIVARQPIEVR
jgi:Ca-activated chloride channel family protein